MIEDNQILNNWYHYAAGAEGFTGAILKAYRNRVFMTQEQQRALLQIQGEEYDQFWLQLQAMPKARHNQLEADLEETVKYVGSKTGIEAPVDVGQLTEMIRTGLEP